MDPQRNAFDDDDSSWTECRPRAITPDQRRRFEGYMAEIFEALGMDLATPGTGRTPERHVQALIDATIGYEGDEKLVTAFPTECHGGPDCSISQIVEGPMPFFALCEHHALPFSGTAHVGYIAHERILGISKLTRLVRVFARRFTVQERMGQQIADTLVEIMEPHGVAVHIQAAHMCTQMRGVREMESRTSTTFWRGAYENDANLRQEFLSLCNRP